MIHVGDALMMDHGEEQTGGRHKPSVLCDAMEAILAAVYLDGGLEAARKIVHRCWPRPESLPEPAPDSKGALQELVQQNGEVRICYEQTGESGPDHNKLFSFAVSVDGVKIGEGSGRTKKEAEQMAARRALETLTK